jgi:hypothetical protein
MLSYPSLRLKPLLYHLLAIITYGKHSFLISLRKQSISGLGMNALLYYTHEIFEPHLIPFDYSLFGDSSEYGIRKKRRMAKELSELSKLPIT